jgi:hypothetical protein
MVSFSRFSLPIISFGLLSLLAPGTQAAVIDKGLTIQVYRLCDDLGNNCASKGPAGDEFFSQAVNKIWAQAGIGVGFNFVGDIWSTSFSFLNDSIPGDGFEDLAGAHGSPGVYSESTVDMFLVHTVAGVYGEGWLGYGGLVMAMDSVMAYNGGNGRLDTVAHELGHNFGLLPDSLGGVGYHPGEPVDGERWDSFDPDDGCRYRSGWPGVRLSDSRADYAGAQQFFASRRRFHAGTGQCRADRSRPCYDRIDSPPQAIALVSP